MAGQRKRQTWFLLGMLISAVFLWIALREINLTRLWRHVRQANYIWLLPTLLAYFVTVGLRAWRWRYLLHPVQRVSWRRLFGILVIGYLGNNIYPFRIGELLRVFLLRERARISLSTGTATLLVERVFDGVTVLSLAFVALPLAPLPANMRTLVTVTSLLFLGLLALFFVLALQPQRILRLADVVGGVILPGAWRATVLARIGRFLHGLSSLRNSRTVAIAYGISVVIWLLETTKYWLTMQAFPFNVNFAVLLLANGIINLATILPSAPGFVGTFDLPGIAVLVLFGVAETIATAFILVLHAALWLPSTVFGFIYMVFAGVNWSDFGRASSLDEAAAIDQDSY